MKRILALLCICWLLAGTALAEENTLDLSGVYTLAQLTEDGETVVTGVAVLLEDSSTLIASGYAVADGAMVAIGTGGTLPIESATALNERGSLMLLTLSQPSAASPVALGNADTTLTCVGLMTQGLVSQSAQHMTLVGYENEVAWLYTGIRDVMPGTLLLNERGELAGVTVAGYGEGIDRYVAIPAEGIATLLEGETEQAISWITGFAVAAERGQITADWSQLQQPTMTEESALYLIWQEVGNSYVSALPITWTDGSAAFGCVPGKSYRVWIQCAADGTAQLSALSEGTATLCDAQTLPPFASYDYRDVSIYLGVCPADETVEADAQVPEATELTVASLTDPEKRYYLQVTSTYQVEEEQEATLVIVLTAPDGSVYVSEGGFIFMPELNEGDTWNAEVTELFTQWIRFSDGVPGTCSLAYYLDGQLASEILLEVQ